MIEVMYDTILTEANNSKDLIYRRLRCMEKHCGIWENT